MEHWLQRRKTRHPALRASTKSHSSLTRPRFFLIDPRPVFSFNRRSTAPLDGLVLRRGGGGTPTAVPGIGYWEIDGLALPVLRDAMRDGSAPNMTRWIADPQAVKPGNAMPTRPLDAESLQSLASYLKSLE